MNQKLSSSLHSSPVVPKRMPKLEPVMMSSSSPKSMMMASGISNFFSIFLLLLQIRQVVQGIIKVFLVIGTRFK